MRFTLVAFVLGVLLAPFALNAQTPSAQAPGRIFANDAATVESIVGTVYVVRAGGRQAILTRDSKIQVGDAINTTRNSSARLRFTDGGETIVRPESTLVVQMYTFQSGVPANDNMLLNLIKGGMRAVTGVISKRGNADAYKLRAATSTVGIRGTDFSVRVCQQDCAGSSDTTHRNSSAPVVARAVQILGNSTVTVRSKSPAQITQGQPLYSGDVIETSAGAFVVLVFRDNSRVVVNGSTSLSIAEYLHPLTSTNKDASMILDLFKGGLRFATGMIGKMDPARVKVRTATSTIGIRGTVFDVLCAPGASADTATTADLGGMPCEESLFAQTREGTITLQGEKGDAVALDTGQSGRVNGAGSTARALQNAPAFFTTQTTPLPEKVKVNIEEVFGVQLSDTNAGVVLTVHEGRVVLSQAEKSLTLDAGESGYAGSALDPVRLFSTPAQLDKDPFLSSAMFSANMCRR